MLTDIQGLEDFFGDMDFKVGGTHKGITAIQVDIKIDGLTYDIIAQAFDLETVQAPLEEIAVTYRDNLVDEYLSQYTGEETLYTWEDDIDGAFMDDWKGWKNYLLQYNCFRGGAHGIQTVCYLVFDAETGKTVSESDLFKDGYREPLTGLLRAGVLESFSYDEELKGLLDMENVVPNGNFTLDAEGIMWVYQPYEVGPYALGVVSASVPWEDLIPLLK